MPAAIRVSFAALAAIAWVGCDAPKPSSTQASATAKPSAVVRKPEILRGPSGGAPVAPFVQKEFSRADAEGREVIVYVGAKWCEPCVRFHDALAAGELDQTFPGLRLLEFDHDTDERALADAGYRSRILPLFAAPNPDGTASAHSISGSIKGPGAVAEISPRLRALLAKARVK